MCSKENAASLPLNGREMANAVEQQNKLNVFPPYQARNQLIN